MSESEITHVHAMRDLAKRKAKAKKDGRVNNASLPAGACMYYYCYGCGLESDVRGEGDFSPVEHHCPPCREMKEKGWLDT